MSRSEFRSLFRQSWRLRRPTWCSPSRAPWRKMTKRITSLRTIEPPRELKPFPYFMSWHPRLTNEAAHAWLREQVRIVARSRAPTRGVVFTEDVVKIAGEQGRYAVGHNGIQFLSIVNFFGLFHLKRMERAGKPRHGRESPRGRVSWEDHESK